MKFRCIDNIEYENVAWQRKKFFRKFFISVFISDIGAKIKS